MVNNEYKDWNVLLDEILQKKPEDLSAFEIAFLKARRSYLKDYQLKEYQSILGFNEKKIKNKKI